MEYAKLQLVHTRTVAWRLACMHARGAAVTILGHCADQENGGLIEGVDEWDDETLLTVLGMKRSDVQIAVDSGLCFLTEEGHLGCLLYDTTGEAALTVRRAQGPHGSKGAEFGKLGAKHGAKGAEFGKLGGRPKKAPAPLSKSKGGGSGETITPPHGPRPHPSIQSIHPSSHPSIHPSIHPAAAAAAEGDAATAAADHVDDGDDTDDTDPRLIEVWNLGGHRVDPDTGEVLDRRWLNAIGKHSVEQIRQVFAEAPRLLEHELRFPGAYTTTTTKLRVEHDTQHREHGQAEAKRKHEERRQAEVAKVEADRLRSAYQVEQLDAFLASLEGAEIRARVEGNPAATKWLQNAHKHARTGAGANLSLHQLARIVPELDRFQQLEPPAGEGSAA